MIKAIKPNIALWLALSSEPLPENL